MKSKRTHHSMRRGFTLIEVMMAMAIMTIAFTAILSTQSSSILLSVKIKEMNLGGWLAHNLMVESEHLMESKPFGELKKEEAGAYPAPYARFKWKREIKEVKFPDFGMFGTSNEDERSRMLGQAVTKFLTDAVRELVITVSWPRGDGEQRIELTTYLINLEATFNFSI